MNSIFEQLNESTVYDGKDSKFFKSIADQYIGRFKELIATVYQDGFDNGVGHTLSKLEEIEDAKEHNRICPRCKENYGINKYWTGWNEIYLCDKCYKEGALFNDVAIPGMAYKPINKK